MAPGFVNSLIAEKIAEAGSHGRSTWRLTDNLVFRSAEFGAIVVPAGFVTDFASVPRAPLAFWLTGDTAHASAVVHDYLCRKWLPRGSITWRGAADVFREAMRHEGVPAWRRALMHWAVLQADPAKKTEWGEA